MYTDVDARLKGKYDFGDTFFVFPKNFAVLQANTLCKLKSQIKDELIVYSLHGVEEISSLYEFQVNILTANSNLDGDSLVGSNVTLEINLEKVRFINGIVSRFTQGMTSIVDNYSLTHYVLEIKPKLWFLSLGRNSRIFQNKSAIDIVSSVLKDAGLDVTDKTSSCGKEKQEYCVQYNESDFHFVSRLMEESGICYFFKHESGKHTVVLCDSSNGYLDEKIDAQFSPMKQDNALFSVVNNVKLTSSYCSGPYASTDYNYTASQTDLSAKLKGKQSKHEIFEYPGYYQKLNAGNNIAKVRIQELECKTKLLNGSSKIACLSSGGKFTLSGHPTKSVNATYVVCSVMHRLNLESEWIYLNEFVAMDAKVDFRPRRVTQRPLITGTQSAIVTGPNGEEIYTDKLRRIKVQFFWDREGKKDENSSCWVRVAQLWSGKTYGVLYTPRIGQEVVVSFENGNPDRPLVVGCVYNDKLMPPYSASEATKSTIKSSSSKGEDGFNEIRFEDLKDSEEIYVHAQKDMNLDIVNARSTIIENADDTLTISKGSRTELLNAEGDSPANYTTTLVKGDKNLTIKEGNSSTILNKGEMSITLDDGNQTIKLTKGNLSLTVSDGNVDISTKGNYSLSVDGNLSISSTGTIKIDAQKDITITSKGNISETATKSLNMTSKMNTKIDSSMDVNIAAKMNLAFEGKLNADLKAGVAMNIKGVSISINGSAATAIKGGASCQISSPMTSIGGGMVALG